MRAEFTRVGPLRQTSWLCRRLSHDRFNFRLHFHPEFELTLVTRGTGTRMIGTSIEDYGPGDLALIGSGVAHAYASSAGTSTQEAIVIQFRRDFLGEDFFGVPEFADVGRLLDESSAAAATVFESDPSTIKRCQTLLTLNPAERTVALMSLLIELAGRRQSRRLDNSGLMLGLSPDARARVDAVCGYLQERFTGSIRLGDVAAVAHMSEAAFSRFFRRSLGRTMTQYVMELRIARARQLLRDSALSISEIAYQCGYENLSNFNRCFRALEDRSPRQYRRALAQVQGQVVG
jgi:AraC-like DNA-binding protein